MIQEFNIGDKVVLNSETAFDYLPEILDGVVGTIIAVNAIYEEYEEEASDIICYDYEVQFPFEFPAYHGMVDRTWVVGEELHLYKKKARKKTGFSKFIRRIEG